MDRYVLSDAQWAKMQPHCLGKKSDPGRSGEDNRRFVEAVLWIARTGSPWRDLPPLFGPWNTVFKRYRDWVKADAFKWRHLIDNFFCKLKEFKRIAMRADKTDQSFQAMIHLAAAVINSR